MVTLRFLTEDEGVIVGDGGFGRDDKFCFGEVQLEVVLSHPGGDV